MIRDYINHKVKNNYLEDFIQISKVIYEETYFFSFLNFRCFIIKPKYKKLNKETNLSKWIWFAPTFLGLNPSDMIDNRRKIDRNDTREIVKQIIEGGLKSINPSNSIHPSTAYNWLFTKLLKFGYCICGIEIGETFGNINGIEIFNKFYEYITLKYSLNKKASLLCQSRGGLMHYNWAVENADKVIAIAGIYPVCNLESWPGLKNVYKFYEYNSVKEMEKNIKKHNPIYRLKQLSDKGIPILHLHGDSDEIVPFEENSLKLIKEYKKIGGIGEVIIIKNEGHSLSSAFFKSKKLLEFLYSF
ncbi:MAG: prolyl oligopeptidase family serine peptidase [Actinobacteria bacterium]|nr:prolyl oligopeptidase family serine peptidase [Actinomycetota bacterium]